MHRSFPLSTWAIFSLKATGLALGFSCLGLFRLVLIGILLVIVMFYLSKDWLVTSFATLFILMQEEEAAVWPSEMTESRGQLSEPLKAPMN